MLKYLGEIYHNVYNLLSNTYTELSKYDKVLGNV